MPTIGSPLTPSSTTALLLGAGELGKELAIELQRLGVEVAAVDRYSNAPAMQVAHRSHTISMLDAKALKDVIEKEKPCLIIPEIEAISIDTLLSLEEKGLRVVPNAQAVQAAMNREKIRRLAAEDLKLPTAPYRIVEAKKDYLQAAKEIGIPFVVKPIMSSSGKGQSIVAQEKDVKGAWDTARQCARGMADKIIVEGFIPFDYEVTLLTVRHTNAKGDIITSFCPPIGHLQEKGDYRQSWQPHPMSAKALEKGQEIAGAITLALGGVGVFGVELFVKGSEVYFNEVSPRPHDTGMVTMISQNLSQFALHVRAILGLPIPKIKQWGPAASSAILAYGSSKQISYSNLAKTLSQEGTEIRLFGKPEVDGQRRVGVALALGESVEDAINKAVEAERNLKISLQ